jgi:hypothetical protein
MKEIIFALIAIAIVATATSYGLEAMNWSAAGTYTSTNVRL